MHLERARARPTTEPREKLNKTKLRFQIEKLEERIAPHRLCYRPYRGGERICLRHQQHG